MIAFPTTGGDEWEYERQGVIGTMAGRDRRRAASRCSASTPTTAIRSAAPAHPRHRSWMQVHVRPVHRPRGDAVRAQPLPEPRRRRCGRWGRRSAAYHAANTLLKHPDIVKRCFALSGVYDMKRFMGGDYDDNFYFNNPVDYCRQPDGRLGACTTSSSCDIHLATGTGPWEHPAEGVPAVGDSREPRHAASSRRLGSAGRPRLAVLAPSDVGVHERRVMSSRSRPADGRVDGARSRGADCAIEHRSALRRSHHRPSRRAGSGPLDHLRVVDPHVAVAREDVDVRASTSSRRRSGCRRDRRTRGGRRAPSRPAAGCRSCRSARGWCRRPARRRGRCTRRCGSSPRTRAPAPSRSQCAPTRRPPRDLERQRRRRERSPYFGPK